MNENLIQTKMLNYLKRLKLGGFPIFYDRRQAGGFNYKEGLPDIYVVINGIHYEIEVKQPEGLKRNLQIKFEERCKKQYNMKYYCFDNFNDFKKLIDEKIKK